MFGAWVLLDEYWIFGFLGDDFDDVSVLYALLGPTVDKHACVSLWDIWKILVVVLRPLVSGSYLFDVALA